MKKTLILFILLFSLKGIAQDPQLFENTWYLNKLVIDNIDYFPPENDEIDVVSLEVYPSSFVTIACESLSGPIEVIDNSNLIINEVVLLIDECFLQETIDFQIIYFNDFFQDKLFVKPHSFRMPVEVAHQILTGGLILEPRGRRGAHSKNDQKHENPRKWEALGAPWSIFASMTPGRFPRKKSPGDGKSIFRNVQPLGIIIMYAQFKTLRTIFQPVSKCSKNRQLFEFEIFGAAQNPTEIT